MSKSLPENARIALKFMVDRGGIVKYSELMKNFDCSISGDGKEEAKSAVGDTQKS